MSISNSVSLMKQDKRASFIIMWRLNDWGLYKRRHEAIARELSRRDDIERVLHVEHISFKGLLYVTLQWLREMDRSLRKAYAKQIKKGFSVIPVRTAESRKLFVYSVVHFYSGENGILRKINEIAKQMQYGLINMHGNSLRSRKILVVYPPSGLLPEAIRLIKHDVLIADLVDDNIGRSSNDAKKNLNIENMKAILPNCNWIFSTSPMFNCEYKDYARQSIDYIPNGMDMNDFCQMARKNSAHNNGKKVAGYLGVINREADMDLLEYAVGSNPAVNFVLIGYAADEQAKCIREMTGQYKNLYYLGAKSHEESLRFLETCDVLINFKRNDHTTSGGESIKTYEYLATGKPIISTPVPPADRFPELMYVTSDKFQFSEFVRAALRENDNELCRKRISAAVGNSWSKRVDVILDKVAQL